MTDLPKVVAYGRDKLAQHEAPAAADLKAGHLVEEVAGGVQAHSTDGGVMDRVLVALDARGRGKDVGDTYSTDPDGTVDNENVPYANCNAGVGLTMLLAAGESVDDSGAPTRLVSAGDGTLRAIDQDGTAPDDSDAAVVAVAAETLDNSGGSSAVAVAVEVVR